MLLRIILHPMVLWRCCLACIILYFIYFDWWNPYPSVPSYHYSPLYFYLTFLHSLSILSLFSASFLRVFIQLLSYSPSTLTFYWLSSSISQCNFQFFHGFFTYSPSLLPWSVSSGHVSLPPSLPLYKFCNNNMLFFWPLPIWSLHSSRSISLHLFVSLSLSLSLSLSFLSFISAIFLSESSIVSCYFLCF